jgi:hypothetical protein
MDEGRGLTDLDRALADALDVDVSPEFAARVRRRIASEPAPSPARWGWPVAAAAAAALVVGAAALAMLSTRRPAPVASPVAESRPVEVARRVPSERPAQRSTAPTAIETRPTIARARLHVPSVAPVPSPASEPEVLVPREEIEMYRRLIAQAQEVPNALVVAAPPDIVAVRSPEIPIDPIKIDLIAPSVDGEGDRQ